jgi:uncharacterized protein (AIM24 family)
MNYQLIGDATQSLLLNLEAGEEIRAEAAYLIACNDAVSMETQSALSVSNPNEPFFEDAPLARFRCLSPGGMVVLGAANAGKVNALELTETVWLCARDSLLATTEHVETARGQQQKIGGGALGNEGFSLRRLSGIGTAFLHVGGALFESTLEIGQSLRVDPACVCAMEEGVTFEPYFVGGFRNSFFGGEGVHLLQLRGAGRVMLQTLPMARLASRVLAATGVTGAATPAASGAFREIGGVFPLE